MDILILFTIMIILLFLFLYEKSILSLILAVGLGTYVSLSHSNNRTKLFVGGGLTSSKPTKSARGRSFSETNSVLEDMRGPRAELVNVPDANRSDDLELQQRLNMSTFEQYYETIDDDDDEFDDPEYENIYSSTPKLPTSVSSQSPGGKSVRFNDNDDYKFFNNDTIVYPPPIGDTDIDIYSLPPRPIMRHNNDDDDDTPFPPPPNVDDDYTNKSSNLRSRSTYSNVDYTNRPLPPRPNGDDYSNRQPTRSPSTRFSSSSNLQNDDEYTSSMFPPPPPPIANDEEEEDGYVIPNAFEPQNSTNYNNNMSIPSGVIESSGVSNIARDAEKMRKYKKHKISNDPMQFKISEYESRTRDNFKLGIRFYNNPQFDQRKLNALHSDDGKQAEYYIISAQSKLDRLVHNIIRLTNISTTVSAHIDECVINIVALLVKLLMTNALYYTPLRYTVEQTRLCDSINELVNIVRLLSSCGIVGKFIDDARYLEKFTFILGRNVYFVKEVTTETEKLISETMSEINQDSWNDSVRSEYTMVLDTDYILNSKNNVLVKIKEFLALLEHINNKHNNVIRQEFINEIRKKYDELHKSYGGKRAFYGVKI